MKKFWVYEILAVFFSLAWPAWFFLVEKERSISDWPLWILNKSVCYYTVLAFLAWSVVTWRGAAAAAAAWLSRTLVSAGVHILMSLCIATPAYFGKFHADGKWTAMAGTALLFGIIAAFIYWTNYCNSSCVKRMLLPMRWGGLFVLLHLAFLGWKGWFDAKSWFYFMPPNTLLCALILLPGVVIAFFPSKKSSSPTNSCGRQNRQPCESSNLHS